jgi:hypothetical protein
MFVVRYVALAALVLWLGASAYAHPALGHLPGQLHWIAAGCGGIILVALFVLKFVGPPPHAFVPRAAIAFSMIVISWYSVWQGHSPTLPLTINLALGLVLLGWYARE